MAIPLAVITFVTVISSPNYVAPPFPILLGTVILVLTIQFVNKPDVTYPDHGVFLTQGVVVTADFIVIGTGSAGAAVAGRLMEIEGWTVISIEAGVTPNLNSEIPQLFSTQLRTFQDWQFQSEVEENACLAQRIPGCFSPRGKIVGGTSAINAMIYVRGAGPRFDRWRDIFGCTGWGYVDVLPYFKKTENNANINVLNPSYHGSCGPMCVSFYADAPNVNFFAQAASEMNPPIPTVLDVNANFNGQCYVEVQGNQCNGRRISSAKAFIIPIKNNPNYRLLQKSTATKIIFEGTKAVGVEIYRNGKKYVIKANKEVILCGGTFGSPILLQLSGIGPKDVLDRNKIPVVAELPQVGRNLYEHVAVFLWFELPLLAQNPLSFAQYGQEILKYYGNPRTGKFAGIGTAQLIAFLATQPNGDAHIEIYHYIMEQNSFDLLELLRWMDYDEDTNDCIMDANGRGPIAQVSVLLLDPYSSGVVEIREGLTGVDAVNNPYIKYNFFSDPNSRDLNVTIKAMQDQLARLQTPTLQSAGAKLIKMPYCNGYAYGSYAFCKCYIQYYASTFYHPAGTCAMGTNSLAGVVDVKGRVFGTQGLRVVDASIMPEVTWGNTNAPSIMIGEKQADQIKSDWGQPIDPPGVC